MKTILDKGDYEIKDECCVNGNWKARFLAKDNEECCQCSFGECKVRVSITYNNNNPYTYILTEEEIAQLPKPITENIPGFEGTREDLVKIKIN